MLRNSSTELSDLLASGQRAWLFTPQVSLPIFDGGRNRSNLDLARARKDGAVVTYEQAILATFRDVADAVAAAVTSCSRKPSRMRWRGPGRKGCV